MSKLFDEEGHALVETMCKLKEGNLSDDELIVVLDHITNCSECAGILADSYDEKELIKVPEGFEESIEFNIKTKNKKQTKFDFGLYCMKVTAAVVIAIIMVFSNQLNFLASLGKEEIKVPDYRKADSICSHLNSISEKIINLEVFK